MNNARFFLDTAVLYLAELRAYLQKQEEVMSPHYSAEIATCVSTVIPASGNRR
jgi:hypothetical protein